MKAIIRLQKPLTIKIVLVLLTGMTVFTSCKKDDKQEIPVPTTKEFVGSQNCASCHGEIYAAFVESGHPYKIMKITDNKQPSIPFLAENVPTPDGYNWSDISYTIGGYGWKMRYIDKNGFVITGIPGSQWNPANNSQSVYNGSVPNGTEKYTCGNCHTTGWKSIENGGLPQDGLAGMGGQFYAGGVHCEACHGEGNIHAITKKKSDIVMDRSGALCAQCHYRRYKQGDLKQQVSGGWEMHRNQHEQLSTNKHSQNGMNCNSCHDPHASTRKDAVAKGNGIKADCASCHSGTKFANVHMNASCIDCHMPYTAKNGISYNKYRGDAPNHNFKINLSETATYITMDANENYWANIDGKGTTLEFACYGCHKDTDGIGGEYSIKTRAELSAKAATFHKN